MGRARGTYTVHTNWVDDLAPSLPGAAGWVLQRLDAQTNYKRQTLTVGQLTDALPFKERTIQQALAYLVQEGYVVGAGREYVLHGACTELAQALRKDARNGQAQNAVSAQESAEIYSAISTHNQKESEGSEGIEEKREEINPKAQESAAPVEAAPSQESVQKTKAPRAARQSKAPTADKVPASPAQQEMFAALALACYGGHDSLTDAARGRVANAAKSLIRANFTAAEVPLITQWMQMTEGETWRSISVSNIEDRAPVWRSAQRGSLPVRVAKPSTIKFNPAAKTTEEANDRVRNRARELYNASKETRRAVF